MLTRLFRWGAVAGVWSAAAVLAVWAVMATGGVGPPVRVAWADGGTLIDRQLTRRGFDRHGYVRQKREQWWEAAYPADLDDIRRDHATTPAGVALPPVESWRLQLSDYGADHSYQPGRAETDVGKTHVLPYPVAAAVLLAPAVWLGLTTGWRRTWRGIRHPCRAART